VLLCATCGRAHEQVEEGLVSFWPLRAALTTELAVAGPVSYLAVWRLEAEVSSRLPVHEVSLPEPAWERIVRTVAPEQAYLYVPGFSVMRSVVQMLGVSLTRAQPVLELKPGARLEETEIPGAAVPSIRLVGVPQEAQSSDGEVPGFGAFSPIVVGRQDARSLAHFVYLALESHEARDLRKVDYELRVGKEELLFIPAVWDPRYIHDANWRLLLREFDGLVA